MSYIHPVLNYMSPPQFRPPEEGPLLHRNEIQTSFQGWQRSSRTQHCGNNDALLHRL